MDNELKLAAGVAGAAISVPGIHSLGAGRYAEAATYGAGEKVVGVVVNPEEVEVHIVVFYPPEGSIPELAQKVREEVLPRAGDRTVAVVVEDLVQTSEEIGG